jgi:hypothetical protein
MLKKLSIILSLFVFLTASTLSFFPKKAHAQSNPWYNQSFAQWYAKVYNTSVSPDSEIFGERYTAAQVQWVIYSIMVFPIIASISNARTTACLIAGDTLSSCIDQFPPNEPDQTGFAPSDPNSYRNKSVLAQMFSPERSLSGVNYVRLSLTKLHLVPEAYAQGFGFNALNPIQNTWKIFRDVMYALFVIIVIIMAFMVMFRYRISPQAVITVQSAIPKVIITLILVTFSYAIAGFLIDLMYVAIGLVALVFNQVGLISGATWSDYFNLLTVGPNISGHGTGLFGWFALFIPALVISATSFFFSVTGISGGILGSIGSVLGGILGIIFTFIFVVWVFFALIRVFILVVKTYISILIKVIFSPLQIGIGALSSSGGFSAWVMSLVSDLAVYPIIGAIFMVALMFLSASFADIPAATWLDQSLGLLPGTVQSPLACATPPCPSWYPPLTFGVQSQQNQPVFDPLPFLWALAALGLLSTITKAGDIVKSVLAGKGAAGAVEYGGILGGTALGVGGFISGKGQILSDYGRARDISQAQSSQAVAKELGYKGSIRAAEQREAELRRQQARAEATRRIFSRR